MGASMKIGQKKYSERMRPPRPTIDYEPQSANQMRTRPSNPLKATFSAEFVAKGWPRNGTDQMITQNFHKHTSIQLGSVLINAQIAAGYALTLRLRHHWYFVTGTSDYGCPKNSD